MIIKITKKEMKLIKDFAHKRMNYSGMYKRRGGFKYMDIVIGAMAEFGAHAFLMDIDIITSKPDLTIHSIRDKSFDADLVGEGKFFHIKGQDSSRTATYGDSWLVQKTDPIITHPKNSHYFMLCSVDVVKESVYIRACVGARTIINKGLLGEPVVDFLKENKHAIYLRYLEDVLSTEDLWRGVK